MSSRTHVRDLAVKPANTKTKERFLKEPVLSYVQVVELTTFSRHRDTPVCHLEPCLSYSEGTVRDLVVKPVDTKTKERFLIFIRNDTSTTVIANTMKQSARNSQANVSVLCQTFLHIHIFVFERIYQQYSTLQYGITLALR
jgi:hypothetical protein